MPERIQLRRTKGWRKPEGCVVVARPSKWGNPFTIKGAMASEFATSEAAARDLCVEAFRSWLTNPNSEWDFYDGRERRQRMLDSLQELRGHDLGCWCGVGLSCHADVLLELANAS